MTLKSFTYLVSKYGKSLIAFMWLISTLIYLSIHGVVVTQEAGKYIEEAHRYIDNGPFLHQVLFLLCYTFHYGLCHKTGIGMFGAFVIQALLNLFAIYPFL
jgi:hypothetical protein